MFEALDAFGKGQPSLFLVFLQAGNPIEHSVEKNPFVSLHLFSVTCFQLFKIPEDPIPKITEYDANRTFFRLFEENILNVFGGDFKLQRYNSFPPPSL